MNRRRQKASAFTLVEMIVVVIVLGVIATLALTGFTKVIELQKYRALRQEFLAIHSAFQMYKARHGHFPNNGSTTDGYVYAFQMNTLFSELGYTPTNPNSYSYYFAVSSGYTNIRRYTGLANPPELWLWLVPPIQESSDPYLNNPQCENNLGMAIPCP